MADFENDSWASRLIVDGDRLWAVGDGIWTSTDGHSWQAIDGFNSAVVTDLVNGAAGYVAVGCGGEECNVPLVWRSRDGFTWKRAVLPVAPPQAVPARVTYAFGRYVIVGEKCPRQLALAPDQIVYAAVQAAAKGCDDRMVSWSSADGHSWVLASPTGIQDQGWTDIFSAGDLLFATSGLGSQLWLSGDGVEWIAGPSFTDFSLRRVVAGPDGFIGIGNDRHGLTISRSTDGQMWQKLDDLPAFAGLFPRAAAATDSGLVVFASSDAGDGAVVWTSTDGTAWTQNPLPDPMRRMYAYDAAVFHGELIAIGGGHIAWHALPFPAVPGGGA